MVYTHLTTALPVIRFISFVSIRVLCRPVVKVELPVVLYLFILLHLFVQAYSLLKADLSFSSCSVVAFQ